MVFICSEIVQGDLAARRTERDDSRNYEQGRENVFPLHVRDYTTRNKKPPANASGFAQEPV
jgi:hypothetical protein